jgi:hypothetical protein
MKRQDILEGVLEELQQYQITPTVAVTKRQHYKISWVNPDGTLVSMLCGRNHGTVDPHALLNQRALTRRLIRNGSQP